MDRRMVLIALARLAAAASGASVYSAWAEPSVLRVAAAARTGFGKALRNPIRIDRAPQQLVKAREL